MGYILTVANKKERLYCTDWFQTKKPDGTWNTYITWKKSTDVPCIPSVFRSEKQAWYYFFSSRDLNPDFYKGYHAEVDEYEA